MPERTEPTESTRTVASNMEHNDFVIGEIFRCGERLWRCTDIGTRVIVAIRIDHVEVTGLAGGQPKMFRTLDYREAEAEGWFRGPPYAVTENVFDENDMLACFKIDPPESHQ